MNAKTTRHPFAIPAIVLSILITSTMTLIPTLAATGTHRAALQAQTLQTTNPTPAHVAA